MLLDQVDTNKIYIFSCGSARTGLFSLVSRPFKLPSNGFNQDETFESKMFDHLGKEH